MIVFEYQIAWLTPRGFQWQHFDERSDPPNVWEIGYFTDHDFIRNAGSWHPLWYVTDEAIRDVVPELLPILFQGVLEGVRKRAPSAFA